MLELTAWWQQASLTDRPWIVLGKGPTFAERHQFDLSAYHRLTLNHAIREQPADVAHIIDIDVVADLDITLLENARWVLMPRRPHVNCQVGSRTLEEYFGEYPVLRQLEQEGRLVWYNLSTSQESCGSPRITARYFSVEAALDCLGELGVRTVRSLGIDGGRGYSADFGDLQSKTMLANGHESFGCQFDQIQKLVEKHKLDYAPLMEPLRVFVGTDESQRVATRVLEHSIRKHTSAPVVVEPMFRLPIPTPRKRANRPRTGFSFYRFMIPQLCGYRGRALYVDADMQVFSDLSELWQIPFGDQTVLCTNQPDTPELWKDRNAFFHPGRQMSVMLLDCERLRWDAGEIVRGLDAGHYTYQQLMFDMCVVPPQQIEDRIPPEWNCLEWFDAERTKLLHYTVVPTQPWKNDENPLASIWMDGFRDAVSAGAVPAGEVLYGIRQGDLKPSLADALPAGVDREKILRDYLHRRKTAEGASRFQWTRIPRSLGRRLRFSKLADLLR